ncbi:MAG TPA: hypothetical protein VII78_05820 [Myxococcota bacterium]|jgi:hypothetical protein
MARDDSLERRVGLCAECAHARVQRSARGSEFWRCGRADDEARYRKYPPLPVRECAGHDRGEPHATRER